MFTNSDPEKRPLFSKNQENLEQNVLEAIELYHKKVTLARAAELADLNFFDFQAILRARGAILAPDRTLAEIQQGVAFILGES